MKVIDAVARILKIEGAEFLSAYPTTPLIEAAAKAEIRPVLCRQERVEDRLGQRQPRKHEGERRTGRHAAEPAEGERPG